MKATLDTFGRVDGCFANAGIGGGGRRAFIDRTEEEWRKMFATNLDGVFHVFQVAARHMTERAEAGDKFGRLVATSSLASLFGTARNEHYAGTKAALNALCRALAVELARYGVTANAILPGWIKSDMTAGIMANDKFVANVMPRIPVRRFGEPTRFRRHRRLHHEQGVVVSHGGYVRDRRRLHGVLRLVAETEPSWPSLTRSHPSSFCTPGKGLPGRRSLSPDGVTRRPLPAAWPRPSATVA